LIDIPKALPGFSRLLKPDGLFYDFFEDALSQHPDINREAFSQWLNLRRTQIQRCELTYIAHQLDFCGSF